MNPIQRLARRIIRFSFDLSVSFIERFSKVDQCRHKVDQLRQLPEGTLGKAIADCLDEYDYTLVPYFESHDLKHVLLDFEMTPEDEIRMQAFMLGNGNYSPASFAILGFGALLLPDRWGTLYVDFRNGQQTAPIAGFTLEDHAHKNLDQLRAELAQTQPRPVMNLQSLSRFGAFAAIIAGVFGMSFCLPFLFSSNMADLVGAGFPFVGGAILSVGGLFVLSNLARQERAPSLGH